MDDPFAWFSVVTERSSRVKGFRCRYSAAMGTALSLRGSGELLIVGEAEKDLFMGM
jgi:hypothetical protein